MGRLDAILGRSELDAPEQLAEAAPEQPALWLDEEPGATPPVRRSIRVPIRVLRAVDGQRRGPI
jgi:hypothetical protein